MLPNFASVIQPEGFLELHTNSAHMVRSAMLLSDHRHPFERILAAQAILGNMALVSIDENPVA